MTYEFPIEPPDEDAICFLLSAGIDPEQEKPSIDFFSTCLGLPDLAETIAEEISVDWGLLGQRYPLLSDIAAEYQAASIDSRTVILPKVFLAPILLRLIFSLGIIENEDQAGAFSSAFLRLVSSAEMSSKVHLLVADIISNAPRLFGKLSRDSDGATENSLLYARLENLLLALEQDKDLQDC